MLSDVQRRKFTRMFNVYDANRSGALEILDFYEVANNMAQMGELNATDPEADALFDYYDRLWGRVIERADKNEDDSVSLEEWLAFCDALVDDFEDTETAIQNTYGILFDLFDADHDGLISAHEFKLFYQAMRIHDAEAEFVFQALDANGDGQLSRDEMLGIVSEFYLSSDADAAGNGLFGPY